MIFNIISNREWEYGQVTVTIKGATTTSTYDAANHSASGYTVTISDPNYKTTDFSFTGTASATGKNAGTYYMGMTSAQFVNSNPRFRNVVFSVTDGYVSISRKAVTVKADNKSKTYGQSDPTLTATVTGTLGSDTVAYSLSRASGSNVGSYTITATGNATQGNYSVTYQTGTLTINKAAASALGLSVTNYSGAYDGSPHKLTATVTVSSGTTIQYSTDNTNWSNTNPQYTNVGTYTVYVRAVNKNYNTATATGTVAITDAEEIVPTSGLAIFDGVSSGKINLQYGFSTDYTFISPVGTSWSVVSSGGYHKLHLQGINGDYFGLIGTNKKVKFSTNMQLHVKLFTVPQSNYFYFGFTGSKDTRGITTVIPSGDTEEILSIPAGDWYLYFYTGLGSTVREVDIRSIVIEPVS